MKKYIYKYNIPCHTVIKFNSGNKAVSLYVNEVYTLPADDSEVQHLLSLNFLEVYTKPK